MGTRNPQIQRPAPERWRDQVWARPRPRLERSAEPTPLPPQNLHAAARYTLRGPFSRAVGESYRGCEDALLRTSLRFAHPRNRTAVGPQSVVPARPAAPDRTCIEPGAAFQPGHAPTRPR